MFASVAGCCSSSNAPGREGAKASSVVAGGKVGAWTAGVSSFAGGTVAFRTAGAGSSIVKYDIAGTATDSGRSPSPGTAVVACDIARADAGSNPTPSLATGEAGVIVAIRMVSGAGFFNSAPRTLNPTTTVTVVISPTRVSISIEGISFPSHHPYPDRQIG